MQWQLFLKLAKYTLLEAIYNKLIHSSVIIIIFIFLSANFISSLAITESKETLLAIQGASLRLSLVLLISLFTLNNVQREIQDKNLELIFSTPVSRTCYLYSKLFGFNLIALIPVSLSFLLLSINSSMVSVFVLTISLYCELSIVIALCLFMLFTFKNAPSSFLFVFIFYIASRSIETIQLMANHPILEIQTPSQLFTQYFVNGLAFILPPLSNFTKTEWLVYGIENHTSVTNLFTQSFVYVLFISALALFDFHRKNI